MSRILFRPHEYQELSSEEQALLELAYRKAQEALRRNITPRGFSACSLADNRVYGTDANYRSVWARDGSKTVIWSLGLEAEDLRQCQRATLDTLFSNQAPNGQVANNVLIETGVAEYAGVGGIAGIDSVMWAIIAMYRWARHTQDWSLVETYADGLKRAMDWLSAHDSNNCGLLEIPEAGDWTDLFARSYHVLYDEVVWYRCLIGYAGILTHLGQPEKAEEYELQARRVKKQVLLAFWPTTVAEAVEGSPRFTETQFSLGDARYLVAQISPFSFSWRCDVYGNLLALLNDVVDRDRAMMTFRFLWGVGVNEPWPVKNLYPPVLGGDPEWREYFTVNLLNLPNHYHNGGIWPFVGGLWVRYINKLGLTGIARRELVKLARLCALGVSQEWEFNEWHHGVTGRPMGKAYQAWSAASFIQACHDLHVEADSMPHEE